MLSEKVCWSLAKRRRTVVLYYAASVALGLFSWAFILRGPAPDGWHGFVLGFFPGFLLSWLILSPGLLGGVHAGGPVRPFSPRYGRTFYNVPIIQLSLIAKNRRDEDTTPADERDVAIRDHAHYLAMGVVRIAMLLLALGVWAAIILRARWMGDFAALGCYLLLLLAMTLPQAIILWTEPDPEPESSLNSTLAGARQ